MLPKENSRARVRASDKERESEQERDIAKKKRYKFKTTSWGAEAGELDKRPPKCMLYKCMLCIFINAIVHRKCPCMREIVSLCACLCSFCILVKIRYKEGAHKSMWKAERKSERERDRQRERESTQLGSTIYGVRLRLVWVFLRKWPKYPLGAFRGSRQRQSAIATTTRKPQQQQQQQRQRQTQKCNYWNDNMAYGSKKDSRRRRRFRLQLQWCRQLKMLISQYACAYICVCVKWSIKYIY